MAGVILENVSRTYPGGAAAVGNLNLEVIDREFLVLVGPSGCGKTTTLRLIAGLEEPDAGKITIGERPVNDVPAKNRDIAMVFQNYALYPHMNVYRNMVFGLELREGLKSWQKWWRWALPAAKKRELAARRFAIAERVHQAARLLGIEHLLDRLPRQLSGGERQRVALGRAIVRSPAVFLFDEPLSNLDAKLRVEMRRELRELHRRLQTTMIYVTHDQVEALTLGDRIVVMNRGQIQQIGSPMEVYQRPANRFVAGFVGTPPMNFLDGVIELVDGNWQFRRGSWNIGLNNAPVEIPAETDKLPVTLGVRPEDVRIDAESGPEKLSATVDLVEMLGDASVVKLRTAVASAWSVDEYDPHHAEQIDVLSKCDPTARWQPGQTVYVSFERGKLQIFHRETGSSLLRSN
jgi:multiple sugar transport system ATP-binding protein